MEGEIRQSQLRTIVADYQKYKNGYDAFKVKFNAVPGDFKDAVAYGLSVKDGDGDSILENMVYNSNGRTPEADNAMYHLQVTGIVDSGIEEHAFGDTQWGTLGKHFPLSSISDNVGIRFSSAGGFYNGLGSCPFYGQVDDINVIVFWGFATNSDEAYAMDLKSDDGRPYSGDMYALNNVQHGTNVVGNRCVDVRHCDAGNPVYTIDETDTKRCILVFSVGK